MSSQALYILGAVVGSVGFAANGVEHRLGALAAGGGALLIAGAVVNRGEGRDGRGRGLPHSLPPAVFRGSVVFIGCCWIAVGIGIALSGG